MATTRTRSTSTRVNASAVIRKIYNTSGVLTSTTSLGSQGQVGTLSIMNDNPHPSFLRDKRQGKIILGDMLMNRTELVSSDDCNYTLDRPQAARDVVTGDLGCYIPTLVPPWISVGADIVKMREITLIEAYARMNSTPLNVGEFLSDLDKTAQMFKSPCKSANSLLQKILTRKTRLIRKLAVPAIRAAKDSWLEYRYGWNPIMMDISSILDEMDDKSRRYLNSERLVARSGRTLYRSGAKSYQSSTGLPSMGYRGDANMTVNVRVNSGVIYDRCGSSSSEHLLEITGLRTSDLPTTAWEVIPYSFVVDWFVGIGDWIRASIPVPGITPRGNWSTTVYESSTTYTTYPYTSLTGDYQASGFVGTSAVNTTEVSRITNQSLPTLPVVKDTVLSPLRSADAIALSIGQVVGLLNKVGPVSRR